MKSNKTINLTCNLESIFWAERYKVVDGIHHDNSHNRSTQRQTTKKLDIISIHHPNLRFTLYKKAFSFHHNAVKILLKWISAPEARDSTKACRFFPPVFSRGRMKGQDSMTSTSLVTPCFEKKIVTNIQRLKARANARNIVGQQDATLLGPTCCERLHTMLCVVACCCDLLGGVGWSLKLVKLHPTTSNKSQQHATTHNMVCKRSQHVGPNNVASCCPTMLRAFARALKGHGHGMRMLV